MSTPVRSQYPVRIIKNLSPSSYIPQEPITKCLFKRGLRHVRPLGLELNIQLNTKFSEYNLNKDATKNITTTYEFTDLPFDQEEISLNT